MAVVFVLLLVFGGPHWEAGARRADSPTADTVINEISEGRLRATVRELVALGPRTGGTPSGDKAAEYVVSRLRALGLRPQVVDDPAAWVYWADRWQVQLRTGRRPVSSAWPYRFSPALAPTIATLIVADADGQTVVGGRPVAMYTQAFSHEWYQSLLRRTVRPVAVLTSAPHVAGQYQDWASIGELATDPSPTIPVFAVGYNDGRRLEQAAHRQEQVLLSLAAHAGRGSPRTVTASLDGASSRYILVTAHGDSDAGGPGADDNASGVSVVLELARVLTERQRRTSASPLPFSLRFVIWGAEMDSARAFVGREAERLDECLAVINFDEVGTGAEREAIYVEGNDVPWNEPVLRAFERVGRHYEGQPGFWPEFTTNPTQGGTDQYVFLPRQYRGAGLVTRRIPSVTVWTAAWDRSWTLAQTPGWSISARQRDGVVTDYSRYYHSSGDTPERTTEHEPANMVRAAKLAVLTMLDLAHGSFAQSK